MFLYHGFFIFVSVRGKVYKIIMICLCFYPFMGEAQTRRALLIGLGQQADAEWAKIHGDRDVALMRPLLSRSGFQHIQVLVNRQATKKGIMSAFSQLTGSCRTGDVVYIHFSGHGQQMTDCDGDEKDRWDECWIPYDARMKYGRADDGSHHLTDDEVNRLLRGIRNRVGPTGKILVVVDACHSGDATRGQEGEVYRGTSERFVLPRKEPVSFVQQNPEEWITLSACRDYQRNAEVNTATGFYGKLTVAICDVLRNGEPVTNGQFYDKLCTFFDRHRGSLPQTPVMSGVTSAYRITEVLKLKK